jgi:REP element-mobilizing transposase RayT
MKPNRRSIRLPGYDYARAGWYFLTICCHNRAHLFGEIVGAYGIRPEITEPTMKLNEFGIIAQNEWLKTADIRANVELGEFVIMPNHMHAIVGLSGLSEWQNHQSGINDAPGVFNTPLRSPSQTIGAIVRGYKSAVTRQLRQLGQNGNIWQRNYYEHIIRNEDSFLQISEYIIHNPGLWADEEDLRAELQFVPIPPARR